MNRRQLFLRSLTALLGMSGMGRAALPKKLPTPGPLPSDVPDWLWDWRIRPRFPVWQADDPLPLALLHAIETGRPVQLRYQGGSQPGGPRAFSPDLLFRHRDDGPLYLSGWCHTRRAARILRVDRISEAEFLSNSIDVPTRHLPH